MSEAATDIQSLTVEQLVEGINSEKTSRDETSDYFAELIRRFEPLLRRAWQRGAFSTEYPEYAQDVFLSLFRRLSQLRSPKAFPGYLRRVALSVAANHARRSTQFQTRDATEIEDIVGHMDESLATAVFIRSYLEHLPLREKKVLTLWHLEDCEVSEIAEEMGLTSNAVRAINIRGIKRLREMLLSEAKVRDGAGKIF